jgi:acetoacetyl-CoA reductase
MTREDWDAVIDTNLNSILTSPSRSPDGGEGLGPHHSDQFGHGARCRPDELPPPSRHARLPMVSAASKGVTVNMVSPGYIGTEMVNAIKPEASKDRATIPVKRPARR